MEERIQIEVAEPLAYNAMFALENYLEKGQLTHRHKGLLKLRASQINGCAFCIDMHTKEALKAGESQQRIFLIGAWRETDLFTEEEKVILELTEEVTLIHKQGLTKKTYDKAISLFNENYFSQLIMAITTINAWNRIALSSHKPF